MHVCTSSISVSRYWVAGRASVGNSASKGRTDSMRKGVDPKCTISYALLLLCETPLIDGVFGRLRFDRSAYVKRTNFGPTGVVASHGINRYLAFGIAGFSIACVIFARLARHRSPFSLMASGLAVWCFASVSAGMARPSGSYTFLLLAR